MIKFKLYTNMKPLQIFDPPQYIRRPKMTWKAIIGALGVITDSQRRISAVHKKMQALDQAGFTSTLRDYPEAVLIWPCQLPNGWVGYVYQYHDNLIITSLDRFSTESVSMTKILSTNQLYDGIIFETVFWKIEVSNRILWVRP